MGEWGKVNTWSLDNSNRWWYTFSNQIAMTEKKPQSGAQRGAHLVQVSCVGGGWYHSRADHDEWYGALPLQGDSSDGDSP